MHLDNETAQSAINVVFGVLTVAAAMVRLLGRQDTGWGRFILKIGNDFLPHKPPTDPVANAAPPPKSEAKQASSGLMFVGLALVAVLAIPACKGGLPSVGPTLDTVHTYVEDAENLLGALETAERIFFLAAPSPDLQTKLDKAITDTRLALGAAMRSVNGAREVSQAQLDAAFADFRGAWATLVTVATDIGIVHPAAAGNVLASGRLKGIMLPDPLALGGRR